VRNRKRSYNSCERIERGGERREQEKGLKRKSKEDEEKL
jgi:hypothetical protein